MTTVRAFSASQREPQFGRSYLCTDFESANDVWDPMSGQPLRPAAILVASKGRTASLDDAVYEYLEWFDLAQHARKLSWRRMSAILCTAGAARENGQPFTVGHLSGVVWRQREKAEKAGRPPKPLDGKWELFPVKLPREGSKRSASPANTGSNHQASEIRGGRGGSTGLEYVATKRTSVSTGSHSKSKARSSLQPQVPDKREKTQSPTGPRALTEDERRGARAFIMRAADMRKNR